MENKELKAMQEEELFDAELQGMGIPFEDETAPKEMPKLAEYDNASAGKSDFIAKSCGAGKLPQNTQKVMDAVYVPVRKQGNSLNERLMGCLKWVGICGGISMLLWWFQVNDLMAIQAAYPCICVCGVLAGFGVGMHAMRGKRYE